MARPVRNKSISYTGRHTFLVTTVTRNRVKAFKDIDFGRKAIAQLLKHAQAQCFALPAYTLMEDHAHVVAEGRSATSNLERLLYEWKKATGFDWSKSGHGRLWQEGYWDRRLRYDEPLLPMLKYVIDNPVRGGLIGHPAEYPLTGSTEFTVEDIVVALESGGIKVPPFRRK